MIHLDMDLMRSISGASVTAGRKAARSVSSFLGISLEDNQLEFWQQRFTSKAKNGTLAPSLVNLLPKRFSHFEIEDDGNEEEGEEETTFGVKEVTAATSAPNRINQEDEEESEKRMFAKSYSDSFVMHLTGPAKTLMVSDTQAQSRHVVSVNLQANETDSSCETTANVERQEKSKISVRFHPSVEKTENTPHPKSVLKNCNPNDVVIDGEDKVIAGEDNLIGIMGDDEQTAAKDEQTVATRRVQECAKCEGSWKKLEEIVRLSKESTNKPPDVLLYGKDAWDYYQKMVKMTPLSKLATNHEISTRQENDSVNGEPSRPTQVHQQVYKNYKPIFLTLITVAQISIFSVLCYFGGIAPIGVTPQLTYAEGVKTFIGTETVSVSVYPNVWIGPNAKYWIGVGAMYSPCMREDHLLRIEFAKQDYDPREPLGCCETAVRNTAGTTTEVECQQFTYGVGAWSLPVCGERASGFNSVAHIIRPCCVGLAGRCEMLSHEHCSILHGTYYQHEYEHCRQINCLEDVCKMGSIRVKANSDAPFYSWHPNQWWRFFLPVFYHNGIIHLLLDAIAQWIILRPIEGIAGSVRVIIIYFTCIFAGNLMSSIFTPYMPQVGATAAVCGFIGVTFIEIIQSRNLTQSTSTDLLKTLTMLTVFIISGTLPFVDNFAQIGGFIVGVLTGIIFLPYVVFGRWDVLRRRLLVCVTTPVLLLIFCMLMLMFYIAQSTEFCSWCHYLNCIPYTNNLCNHTWLTYQPF